MIFDSGKFYENTLMITVMRKSIIYLLAAAGLAVMPGCSDDPIPNPGNEDVPVEEITLDKTSLQLVKGDKIRIEAVVSPENATDKTIAWESSDSAVVEVSEDGTVTAMSVGAATVTASAGDKTAFCTVTVSAIEVESVSVEPVEISIIKGETFQLRLEML